MQIEYWFLAITMFAMLATLTVVIIIVVYETGDSRTSAEQTEAKAIHEHFVDEQIEHDKVVAKFMVVKK
jgi:hypothetical protein